MITPRPQHAAYRDARFFLGAGAAVSIDDALAGAQEGIFALLPTLSPGEDGAVCFAYDASLAKEAYRLTCDEAGARVAASDRAGALHGAASLRQLLLHGEAIPHLALEDAPRFGWRSLSMDVCRHFFPIATLKKLVDLLALYKYNALHLHISDDQGFRVESERFPKLNAIGAWRATSAVKRGRGEVQDGLPHGGFYTKDEVRALVSYAASRGIMIVPEVDVPGHTTAILAAYPELACEARETEVATSYGIKDFSSHILCAGNEAVYRFLESLIEELAQLFPAPYFHLGGDEAGKREWEKCPKCQAVLRAHKLAGERELQGFMLERLRRFLLGLGKEAVIWNDGLASTTGTDFICELWTPPAMESARRTAAHLNAGGRAIISGFRHLYFDYPYALTPLKKSYEYDMVPKGVGREAEARILGGECCLWTEWIEDEEKLFFSLLPRLAAAAELFWSADDVRDYAHFTARLPAQYRLYEELALPWAKGMEHAPGPLSRLRAVQTFFQRDAYVEVNRAKVASRRRK